MRVIKKNMPQYESFYETLPSYTMDTTTRNLTPVINSTNSLANFKSDPEQKRLFNFRYLQNKINKANNIAEIDKIFAEYIKGSLGLGQSNFFLLDENNTVIESVSFDAETKTKAFINSLLNSGLIKDVMSLGKPRIISDDLLKDFEGEKSTYLLMPFGDNLKNNGLLSVKISPSVNIESVETSLLQIGLDIISNKIEMLDKQQEVISAYNELQLFQSRLANDYKLSAIGELTTGILDDILSPLQVITSYIDLIRKDECPGCEAELDTIGLQAKKINRVVGRLINFAKPVEGKLKIQPCDINDTIIEFYEVVISSLKNENYECILDLDENIPGILSHPNYLTQILMNIFFLLKPGGNKGGGVLLQSKYQFGKVIVRFFTTEYSKKLESREVASTRDVNIKIIQNLVKQQQGELKIDSDAANGTIVTISFPIKRNI